MADEAEIEGWARKRHQFLSEFYPTELQALVASGDLGENLRLLNDEAEDEYNRIVRMHVAAAALTSVSTLEDREAAMRFASTVARSEVMREIVFAPPQGDIDHELPPSHRDPADR